MNFSLDAFYRANNIRYDSIISSFILSKSFPDQPITIMNSSIFFLKQGCRTIVHCATEDVSQLRSGKFYRNKIVDESIETFLDTKFTQQNCVDLFRRSQEAVGLPSSSFVSMVATTSNHH